jgi:hypothetical protein
MTEIEKLVQVIRDLHHVEATHAGSERVRETFRGDTVWDGVVEVFTIRGHPQATTAYAWSHETDEGGRRYVAVLQVPPVNSPVDAVRAAIVAEIKQRTK